MSVKPFLFSFTKFYPGEFFLIIVGLFLIYRKRGRQWNFQGGCPWWGFPSSLWHIFPMEQWEDGRELFDCMGKQAYLMTLNLLAGILVISFSLLVISFTQFYPWLFTCIHSFSIGNCDSRWLQPKSNHFQQHGLESLAVLGQMLV